MNSLLPYRTSCWGGEERCASLLRPSSRGELLLSLRRLFTALGSPSAAGRGVAREQESSGPEDEERTR